MYGRLASLSFRSQLIAAILLLGAFGALPMIVFGKHSVDRIDGDAAAREAAQVRAAIAQRFESLATEQRSATIWDDAVLEVKKGNSLWMEGNLGVWMQTYFGHDLNFVLNPALEPVHAAVDRKTRPAEAFDAVASQILPLAQKAQAMVLSGDLDPAEVTATDYVLLDNGPALVSVVPIIPDSSRMIVGPPAMYFHVAVDFIDAAYVATVTDGLALSMPTLVGTEISTTESVSVAIEDAQGVVIERLGWTAVSPAGNLVAALSPALALWLFSGAILVFWLAAKLIRTSAKLQHSEAQARFLAFHDPLTRLPNRALFEERLGQALAKSDRSGRSLTLLMLDLDQFKNVNDTFGHPAGDELIRQVGERIKGRLRQSDTVARLGGDEFAVILDGEMSAKDLVTFCEGLLREISGPFDLHGNVVQISVSIGVCTARKRLETGEELVRRADIALYQAKRTGRQRHCFFGNEMDTRLHAKKRHQSDRNRPDAA